VKLALISVKLAAIALALTPGMLARISLGDDDIGWNLERNTIRSLVKSSSVKRDVFVYS
jgi:hypothetical protein